MLSRKLQELTWQEVERLNRDQTLVIVPTGSLEQHGYHLPLGSDTYITQAVIEAVIQRLGDTVDYIVLPVIPIGQSPEHMNFAGTVTFRVQTYHAMIADICASLARHGFKKIVFLNGHGGNTDILRATSYQMRLDYDVLVFEIDFWGLLTAEGKRLVNRQGRDDIDSHAAELETSLIMHLHPTLVRGGVAVDELPAKFVQGKMVTFAGPVFVGWSSNDVSPSGVSGEPSKAAPEKGERLVEFFVDAVCQAIQEIARNW